MGTPAAPPSLLRIPRLVQHALSVFAVLFLIATALPLIRKPYWWVRIFDFPRVQLAIGGAVVLVLYLLLVEPSSTQEWVVLGLLALAVAYQIARMIPYTPLYPVQVMSAEAPEPAQVIRLVVSNVMMDNRERERWLDVIRQADPDVLLVLETDGWWIAQAAALHERYPYRIEVPKENTYGMLLLLKWPIEPAEVRHLVEDEVPSIWGKVAMPGGARFRLVAIHPRPPRVDIRQDTDLRDAELVLVAQEVATWDDRTPVVVAGDLNDVAWSSSTKLFQRLSGLLDPRVGRGMYATFHAKNPLLRCPLDHVFHSDEFTVKSLRLLDKVGSDHFPICIELVLAPEARARQAEPKARPDDQQRAESVLEERATREEEETEEERRTRNQEDR